jgi:hypothetical protein
MWVVLTLTYGPRSGPKGLSWPVEIFHPVGHRDWLWSEHMTQTAIIKMLALLWVPFTEMSSFYTGIAKAGAASLEAPRVTW